MDSLIKRNALPVPVARKQVAANWAERGYSCDLFVDPPGQEWLNFVHGCNELVTVVEGKLDMEVGDARFIVEPGDEVFIPKGANHSLRNVHPGVSKWLYGYD
jgi:mannose-6-phosphate isomerase-like protein (cupin superfamily)